MEDKLVKSCPFCGDKDVWKRVYAISGNVSFVCCRCGAEVMFHNATTDPKATEFWNKRTSAKEN